MPSRKCGEITLLRLFRQAQGKAVLCFLAFEYLLCLILDRFRISAQSDSEKVFEMKQKLSLKIVVLLCNWGCSSMVRAGDS